MDDPDFEILSVDQARRALTDGDIKSDVAFQNDVNRLLAFYTPDFAINGSPLADAAAAPIAAAPIAAAPIAAAPIAASAN